MHHAWTHDFGLRIWRLLPDADNASIALELRDDNDRVQFSRVWLDNPPRLEPPTSAAQYDAWTGLQANAPAFLLLGEWQDPQFPGITQYYRLPYPDGQPEEMAAKTAQQLLYNQQLEVHLPFARNVERAEPTAAFLLAQDYLEGNLAPHYDELQRHGVTIISVYIILATDPSEATPGLLQQELMVLEGETVVYQTTLQAETQRYSLDPFSIIGEQLVFISAQSILGLLALPPNA